ncbi:MAG: enoyl-CoA hydratase/isomerase family protein [Actinomycetota bacterium]
MTGDLPITVDREGPVRIVRLSRPTALNTFDDESVPALATVVADLGHDPDVRCVVITGEGRAFSAGAQLGELLRRKPDENQAWNHGLVEALDGLAALPVPTIAAINGHAIGGGLELALACTLRLAADSSVLGLPEVKLGILPGAGGTQRLPRLLPPGTALRLLLTGDLVSADEAARLGLVEEVVPADELLDRSLELARAIAGAGPLAVRAILAAVRAGLEMPLDSAISRTESHLARLFETEDFREGAQAFLDKRPPKFTGR